jgi:hypothetical protein
MSMVEALTQGRFDILLPSAERMVKPLTQSTFDILLPSAEGRRCPEGG